MAYLLVRRYLKRRTSRNQALVAEAMMEELACHVRAAPREQWGVLGLLSQLDLEYAEHNPDARGSVALEQARLEGLEPELARALAGWAARAGTAPGAPAQDPGTDTPPPEAALSVADHVAARLAGPEAAALPGALRGLGQDLALLTQGGTPEGDRLEEALDRLDLAPDHVAVLARSAWERVAQDLR